MKTMYGIKQKYNLKDYEMMKNIHFIAVDKKINIDDLEKLKNQKVFVGRLEESKVELLFDEKIQKKLKVLEIIKEKNVKIDVLKYQSDVVFYNMAVFEKEEKLTEEEFSLLKEVFSW